MIIGLDLSLMSTGYVIVNKEKTFFQYGKIPTTDKLTNIEKISFITEQILNKIISFKDKIEAIIVEDLYYNPLNKNFQMLLDIAHLAGAVIYECKRTIGIEPILLKAASARSKCNINPKATKAEIQIWVSQCLKMSNNNDIKIWGKKIIGLKEQFKLKKLTRNQYLYRLEKISLEIENKTTLGNDVADAFVLAFSYK